MMERVEVMIQDPRVDRKWNCWKIPRPAGKYSYGLTDRHLHKDWLVLISYAWSLVPSLGAQHKQLQSEECVGNLSERVSDQEQPHHGTDPGHG